MNTHVCVVLFYKLIYNLDIYVDLDKIYLAGRNRNIFNSSNIEFDCEEEVEMLSHEALQTFKINKVGDAEEFKALPSTSKNSNIDELHMDGLENLGGFILQKLKNKINLNEETQNNQNNWTWVNELSEGGLMKPSETFLKKLIELEKIFLNLKSQINNKKKLLRSFMEESKSIDVNFKVKRLFFRCRIFFFIKQENINIKKNIKKLKNKKIKKFIL